MVLDCASLLKINFSKNESIKNFFSSVYLCIKIFVCWHNYDKIFMEEP